MARNDHYVSQTYLRGFVGPTGDIVPYYKNAHVIVGKPKKTKSICFETKLSHRQLKVEKKTMATPA